MTSTDGGTGTTTVDCDDQSWTSSTITAKYAAIVEMVMRTGLWRLAMSRYATATWRRVAAASDDQRHLCREHPRQRYLHPDVAVYHALHPLRSVEQAEPHLRLG